MSLPDNNILDVVISLVLIYALLSVLVSVLVEWWHQKRKTRAKLLKRAIFQMLNDPFNMHYGELFYNHYLINGLRNEKANRPPQYISSTLFADVLIDVLAKQTLHNKQITSAEDNDVEKRYKLTNEDKHSKVLERFEFALENLKPSPFSDALISIWEKSGGENQQEEFKTKLSFWYDDYMDRVSGWFKYEQRWKLRVVAFIVAIALNVDSLHLVKMISMDDSLRRTLVETAEVVADEYSLLSDSSKQKTQALENIFNKTFPDSTLRNEHGYLRPTKEWIKKVEKDSLGKKWIGVTNELLLQDSLSTEYRQRVNRLLNISASLNIPIGWNESMAPLSWWSKQNDLAQPTPGKESVRHAELLAYADKRNTFSTENLILYIIGIFISGMSLSFGAPFWFDTLIKLINVRKAGKKPEALNVATKK